MSNVLRIALVDPNDGSREALKGMLLGMDTIWLEADCSRYEFYPDVIEQTAPDVGIIALDSDTEQAINLISRLAQGSAGDGDLGGQRKHRWSLDFASDPSRCSRVFDPASLGRRSLRCARPC